MASFATPADLAAWIPTPLNTTRMQALLDAASGLIRLYTGQMLSQVPGDQVEFGPSSSTLLVLPETPVTAVSAITVNAVAVTAFTWGRWGNVWGDVAWTDGAIVTYDHGYAATDPEIAAIKAICMSSASRAYTLNERSASEVFGATVMESAGYSPEVFLTPGEMRELSDLTMAGVG